MPPPKPRTIFLLRLLQLNIYNLLVEQLRPSGLTPIQYMVLSISSHRGSWSSAELARRFQIAPQSMTEIVASLESKKLIARSRSAEHGRILNIRLTAAGARVLAKCDTAVDRLERDAFADFTAGEIALFRQFLARSLATMRDEDVGIAPQAAAAPVQPSLRAEGRSEKRQAHPISPAAARRSGCRSPHPHRHRL